MVALSRGTGDRRQIARVIGKTWHRLSPFSPGTFTPIRAGVLLPRS
ncbi:MAG TPA: hypothetical protein VKZ79_11330 [Alphaproteobacteria bacterium]|nr:hypothetical protein [Alphaproteobacteria bacterium]